MSTIELLKKVRKIEIKTKGLSNHIFAGEYQTAFKGKCVEFLEKFNLEYVHSVWANDHELEIAMNDETPVVGGTYLALCIIDPPGQMVNAIKVKGFLDTVKGEGASRGIFITTGYFSDEAIRSIDEEPVELVDVVSFVSYLKRFGIYEIPHS